MFRSFFLAGFECATGVNRHGRRFDQIAATQHDAQMHDDFRRIAEVGIRAARCGVRWNVVDCGRGRYDLSSVRRLIDAARRNEIEVIYDLFHFGYPTDLDIFSDEFVLRFRDYCHEVARLVDKHTAGVCYFTPVNEPSYLAWAAGDAGLFRPHETGRSWELKIQLARAAIEGINAIRAACRDARIVNVDPVCRVAAPHDRPELGAEVNHFNSHAVFQTWDMLSGKLLPELGGSPRHLDIIGMNYYWTNQWEWGDPTPLQSDDPRYTPLRQLLREVWERYETEIVITETSHVGEMRPLWLRELTEECEAAMLEGVPLRGVCLYPILGMPEWHAPDVWTRMGLWDCIEDSNGRLERVIHQPTLAALRDAQARLESYVPRRLRRAA